MLRRMRKQVTHMYNPWNHNLEIGDRVYDDLTDKVFDLMESTGWGKARAGDLTPVEPKAQRNGAKPVCKDGVWYWKTKEDEG